MSLQKEKEQERKRTDRLFQKAVETITAYEMIAEGDHVLAGVSGGADSVCMLAVLKQYQEICRFQLTAVHVEHGIRGAESLQDQKFVEKLCRNWGIPLMVCGVDAKKRAEQYGESLEEAARKLRYESFYSCCREVQGNCLAAAHNQNDQAETVLLNLTRGSGLRGLGGILPVRELGVGEEKLRMIRPLLFVSREEIEAWMEEREIPYCTDATNLESDYARNRIRLQILPQLEQGINQEAIKHMAEAALHLQRAEQFIRKQTEQQYQSCVQEEALETVIDLEVFLQAEPLIQEYLLRMALERRLESRGLKDYTQIHIQKLRQLAGMDCGKRISLPGGIQAVRKRKTLTLECRKTGAHTDEGADPVWLLRSGTYEFLGHRFYAELEKKPENIRTFPEKKYTKWLAYDTIKDNLCLRTRKTGDYLIVNQAGGRKKLKEYLIEQKIPREERDLIPVLAAGSHILWVVGWRISEAAKVTEKSDKILQIQMMEEEV